MTVSHEPGRACGWRRAVTALAGPVAILMIAGTASTGRAQSFDPLRDLRRACEVLERSGVRPGTEELRLFCPLLARAEAEDWPLERLFREMERARSGSDGSGSADAPGPGGTFGDLGLDRDDLEHRSDWRGRPGGSAGRGGSDSRVDPAPDPGRGPAPGDAGAGPYDGSGGMANSWSSNRSSEFSHVLRGEPGPVTLVLEARTDMPGGQTVTVYRADPRGRRLPGAGLSVIATRDGNVRTAPWTIPAPPQGESQGVAHLAVVVTNHAGGHYSGDYRISVER